MPRMLLVGLALLPAAVPATAPERAATVVATERPLGFARLDRDGDGYLSGREMPFPGDPGLRRRVDADGDGRVSRSELRAFLHGPLPRS